ncbi:hypothetical protein FHG87_001101 [Trinorchestia longiramus]|nr:hypothetical protein FHG87_001101 [Trinorchestia longiramus]
MREFLTESGSPRESVMAVSRCVCDGDPQISSGSVSTHSVSQSGPYRPPGGVEEMQGGGRRVRLEWGAYINV